MIKFLSLKKVPLSLEAFIKKSIEFNFQNAVYSFTNQNNFFFSTENIFKFVNSLQYIDENISIYQEKLKYLSCNYYVIDETGLSHGCISGPDIFNEKNYADSYYGNNININSYDCVDKMGAQSYKESMPVDLKCLRESFLPLSKIASRLKNKYFLSYNTKDNDKYGPLIYKSIERSFLLPFVELFKNHFNTINDRIKVKIIKDSNYLKLNDGIRFETTHLVHTGESAQIDHLIPLQNDHQKWGTI